MDAFGDADSPLVQAFNDANGKTFDHEAEITRIAVRARDDRERVRRHRERQLLRLGARPRRAGRRESARSTRSRPAASRSATSSATGVQPRLHGEPDPLDVGPRPHQQRQHGHVELRRALGHPELRRPAVATNGVFPANPAVGSGANPLQTVELLQNREDVWRVIGGANAALDAYKSKDGNSKVKLLANFGADSFDQKNNILSPNELIFEPTPTAWPARRSTRRRRTSTATSAPARSGPTSRRPSKFRNALSGGLTYETVDLSSVYVTAQNLTAGQPNVDSRHRRSTSTRPGSAPRTTRRVPAGGGRAARRSAVAPRRSARRALEPQRQHRQVLPLSRRSRRCTR